MARPNCVTHPLFNRRLPCKLRKFNIKPNFIKKKHQTRRERKGRNTKRGPPRKPWEPPKIKGRKMHLPKSKFEA
jgi:hypothetical protein